MLMCRDLARIASDYIDGELGTGKVMSVKMHLLDEDLVRRIDERVSESLNARHSGNDTSDP